MKKRNQLPIITLLRRVKLKPSPKRIVLLFCLLLVFVFVSYQAAYVKKIYPGINVLELCLSNLTTAQAQTKIDQLITQKQTDSLPLIDDNKNSYSLNLKEINFTYQSKETVDKAFDKGRGQNLGQNLTIQFELLMSPINLILDYEIDNNKLSEKIASLAAQLDKPQIAPSLSLKNEGNNKTIILQEGQDGSSLEQVATIKTIKQNLAMADFTPILLSFKKTINDINQEQIDATIKVAEKLINKKILLSAKEDSFLLTDEDLVSFLNFKNDWQEEKVASWLKELAETIDRPAQNAAFKFENGRVLEFKPAQKGLELQIPQSLNLLEEKLNQLPDSQEQQLTVNLAFKEIEPSVETGSVNDLGIEEKVSQGKSFFKGSIPNRVDNVALAAEKINGILIKPNEVFSFNLAVGDISIATGFKQAYIIKDGKTILGDGGGVCQVSTTLFRTALNAGLEITERRAHAYRVSYYEQNSEPGFDATVFSPSTDLKFKNNTPAHLLIQTKTDITNRQLTIELYGKKDNRVIAISKAKVWDQTPPPPDLYQDDPTLPIGTVKQIDWKSWGAKTSFDYKSEKDGQILQQKTFYSNYRPWQAIFLKGTKEN